MSDDTVQVPVELLKRAVDLLPQTSGAAATHDALEALIPKPPTQEYFVVYRVRYRPEVSADPDVETPPMDMTHSLDCTDPRFVTYGLEQIGLLEHVRQWLTDEEDKDKTLEA